MISVYYIIAKNNNKKKFQNNRTRYMLYIFTKYRKHCFYRVDKSLKKI